MSGEKIIEVGQIVYKKVRAGACWVQEPCACTPDCDYILDKPIVAIVTMEVVEPGFIPFYDKGQRKGRVRAAKVISIECLDGAEGETYSDYDKTFKYVVGEIVRPRNEFSDDVEDICASGIHCFETKEQAERYNF